MNAAAPLRALVLAAGRGERLRPLTRFTPKPLLPVLGESILERTLARLEAAGVESAAVNLHHLGEQIPAQIGDRVDSMKIVYSPEVELLGTLGPLARLRDFLGESDPVLLVNGDSLCDWPIEECLAAHREGGADATLLLSSRADPEEFGGGVEVDEEGRVVSFHGLAPGPGEEGAAGGGVFAGLHVISSGLLVGIAERFSDIIRELYEPLIAGSGTVRTVFTDRAWHDMGTPRRYLAGVFDVMGGDDSWISENATVHPTAGVSRSVIEAGVDVEAGAVVERSVLLPGSQIGRDSGVEDSLIGPRSIIPPDLQIDGEAVAVDPREPERLVREPI